MFHYRKDFNVLTRDYRAQDEAGLPEITPVVIADDLSIAMTRTRPTFQGNATQAAVAAVFSTIGIQAGTQPVVIRQAQVQDPAAGDCFAMLAAATLITANAGTWAAGGLTRQGASVAVLPTGTAAAATVGYRVWDEGDAQFNQLGDTIFPLVLRTGEFFFFQQGTANLALSASFWWEEWAFALQRNPPSLV